MVSEVLYNSFTKETLVSAGLLKTMALGGWGYESEVLPAVDQAQVTGNLVSASVVADQVEAAGVSDSLDEQYPALNERSMVDTLPRRSHLEARLYQVMLILGIPGISPTEVVETMWQ